MIITSHYYSFLLRIWQPEKQVSHEWLASLEDPKSREVIYFKNMEEMFDYLRKIPDTKKKSEKKI
ncbi:MAG: hypothetical protein Q7U53_09575 [Anaerolineaceae bacterium]|nr:hypothetical protein [Anaerolineaceae bacterium]